MFPCQFLSNINLYVFFLIFKVIAEDVNEGSVTNIVLFLNINKIGWYVIRLSFLKIDASIF